MSAACRRRRRQHRSIEGISDKRRYGRWKSLDANFSAPSAAAPRRRRCRSGALRSDDAYPKRFIRLLVPYAATGTAPDLHARIFAEPMSARTGAETRRREPPRRRRHDWGCGRRKGAGRRLHDPLGGGQPVCLQPVPLQEPAISFRRFHADRLLLRLQFRAVRAAGPRRRRRWPQLLDKMRAEPGGVRFANGGIGSQLHLTWERLMRLAKVEGLNVPFQTGGTLQRCSARRGRRLSRARSRPDPVFLRRRARAARDHQPDAPAAAAGCPDLHRIGFPELHRERRLCGPGPARHARRDRHKTADGLRRGDQRSRDHRKARSVRRRSPALAPRRRLQASGSPEIAKLWRKIIEESGVTLG